MRDKNHEGFIKEIHNSRLKRRWLSCLSLSCLLGVLMLLSSCATGPHGSRVRVSRFGSENHIRNKILKYTPIGSTYEQVQEFIQYRLKYRTPDYENSPAIRGHWPGPYEEIGVRRIDVWLGEYGFPGWPMAIDKCVSWAFDKNDKLIDVVVWKDHDSM
jgi:hypothetical protein